MIALNGNAITDSQLSSSGDKLRINIPPFPAVRPDPNGGFLVIRGVVMDQRSSRESVEVVSYSGYDDDGRTLLLTGRGLQSTTAQMWPPGVYVCSAVVPVINELLEQVKCLAERLHRLDGRGDGQ